MTAVWVFLGVLAALLAALLGAAAFFFKFSICRYKRERTDEQYEEQDSIWNPFAPRMKEAQAFIRAHTAEHVRLTSFDGLALSALWFILPARLLAESRTCALYGESEAKRS